MKKIIWTFLLLILAIPVTSVFAYPPCGPYAHPSDEWFCRVDNIPNQLLRVRPEVPFVWIRNAASSDAAILTTVRPSTTATMILLADANQSASISWDGYQWWWEVELYPAGGVRGWVEMASLSAYIIELPTPTTDISDPSIQLLSDWVLPLSGRIETGMSFAWVRETPSSGGRIVHTLRQGQEFELTGGNRFDGYQWWWAIRTGAVNGWLEQGSITPVSD